MNNSGKETDSPLPSFNERLAHLRPSRELLEFYKEKIAQFDGEHGQLLKMLEKYKSIIEDQVSQSDGILMLQKICSYVH